MTHAIVHPRVSTVTDGTDPDLIHPSDWNATHSINWGFATPNTSTITSAMADVAGDAYFDKVSLLLHCNGADLSTTFVDNSPTPKTVSVTGAAKIRTNADGLNPVFGNGKARFNGTSDSLSLAASSDFVFGTDDFTVECWIYPTISPPGGGNTADPTIFGHFGSPSMFFFLLNSSYAPSFYNGTTTVYSSILVSANAWSHVAFCRAAGVLKIFVNGAPGYTGTNTINFTASTTNYIGGHAANRYLNGYMDDIRITKGLARYTGPFTPHTIAHYDSFPGVNLVAGKNYTSTGPIEIQDTDVNIPNGAEWVIV